MHCHHVPHQISFENRTSGRIQPWSGWGWSGISTPGRCDTATPGNDHWFAGFCYHQYLIFPGVKDVGNDQVYTIPAGLYPSTGVMDTGEALATHGAACNRQPPPQGRRRLESRRQAGLQPNTGVLRGYASRQLRLEHAMRILRSHRSIEALDFLSKIAGFVSSLNETQNAAGAHTRRSSPRHFGVGESVRVSPAPPPSARKHPL